MVSMERERDRLEEQLAAAQVCCILHACPHSHALSFASVVKLCSAALADLIGVSSLS